MVFEVGKKYNARTLRSMRQLYETFNDDIWKPLVSKLSWTQLLIIMPIKDNNKKMYYVQKCLYKPISKRELQLIIKSKEYERLDDATKEKIIHNERTNLIDLIPNPIIIKNTNKYENISEKILQQIIMEDIPSFLESLGNGYTFIKNEYKIKIGNQYNYIDLLLYNYLFNAFIVIELKTTELKKDHIGQIQVYMNYIDKYIKTNNQNKTIGIIICKKDNKYIIEYSSDKRIITKEYLLI